MQSKNFIRTLLFWGIIFYFSIEHAFPIAHLPLSISDSITLPSTSSRSFLHDFRHSIEIEGRYGYIFPTNPFLKGYNKKGKTMRDFGSLHLKYAFQYPQHSLEKLIFGDPYQGVGLAKYTFHNRQEIGDPTVCYLFQGARILKVTNKLSLNYEWNFGLSWGWKPYHKEYNWHNGFIGSKWNAYMNTNFYLNWQLSPGFRLTSGFSLAHFSNGNTKYPNGGINTISGKLSMIYYFHRKKTELPQIGIIIPEFPRHMSYDIVVFGSWRRKMYTTDYDNVYSPKLYSVLGANFSAMYNLSYKIRLGGALDFVYDSSANKFIFKDPSHSDSFVTPPLSAQIALGISGRTEYVMPYFSVGIGMGINVLHRGGDLNAFYQMLFLKIAATRNSFIHIGYNLQEFNTPNYLMLGFGFRFNNKYPQLKK